VYGISGDAPSANARFKEKQKLEDITMLCDGDYSLHKKLGIAKGAKGTVRSVLVVAKDGKVLGKGPASPANSVALAKGWAGIDEKKE
jgi:peroxiredoxin